MDKNRYTARFFDYYGWEFEQLTKSFATLKGAKNYFNKICDEQAIPFAQLDRNDQAIGLNGRRIGADCDSRKYA